MRAFGVRRLIAASLVAAGLVAAPAAAESIQQVLARSQQLRLEQVVTVAADDARALVIRQSFERVLAQAEGVVRVELQVVTGPVVAETFHGSTIVANVSLADLPEGERAFILAHELGHVAHAHWATVNQVYAKHIPGEVLQSATDAVAGLLGREMSALSHQQEFEADAYGLRTLQRMGWGVDTALATFTRAGVQFDTATHPATRKRMASLRLAAAGASGR